MRKCKRCGAVMARIDASQPDGTDLSWYECSICNTSEDA